MEDEREAGAMRTLGGRVRGTELHSPPRLFLLLRRPGRVLGVSGTMNQPWVGRFDDPTIKMVNFIKGNVSVTDDTGTHSVVI